MIIYYGKRYADVVQAQPDLVFFEDVFNESTSAEYPQCWDMLPQEQQNVGCKTEDAIRCAPLDAKLIRIGRSVRASDKGQLIQIELTVAEFLFLVDDIGDSTDRRSV